MSRRDTDYIDFSPDPPYGAKRSSRFPWIVAILACIIGLLSTGRLFVELRQNSLRASQVGLDRDKIVRKNDQLEQSVKDLTTQVRNLNDQLRTCSESAGQNRQRQGPQINPNPNRTHNRN